MKGRERERTIDVWLPLTHPVSGTWPTNQACALDWKANWPPFGGQHSIHRATPARAVHWNFKKHIFTTASPVPFLHLHEV